ncbi:MAG TPA: hypothetical protein VFZ34_19800 [Blastocatellia bacterium]|nr:hypothetical protein [Blastocatellia bacterium]
MKVPSSEDQGELTTISEEEVRQVIQSITNSKYFSHAPKKQKFIHLISNYYLQGRTAELNEYLIGYEVFDKRSGYNPSTDPVVRVSAHDVRKKLELYYQNEGASDQVRMLVPVGTYVPVFLRQTAPAAYSELKTPEPAEATEVNGHKSNVSAPRQSTASLFKKLWSVFGAVRIVSGRRQQIWQLALMLAATIILILVGVTVWLLRSNWELQHQLTSAAESRDKIWLQSIWEPFITNQYSTVIVLSNPVVYRTVNGADPDVMVKKGVSLTSEQENYLTNLSNDRLPVRQNHPLQLIPAFNMYTGIGEAIGAYRLNGLLQSFGETSLLKQSRSVGADDLKGHDAILLGSVYSNQWAKPLSLKENFVYSTRTSIENLSPQPGEQREYISAFDPRTGALLEDYALITVVPGVAGTNMVMSLSGIYSEGTQAAVEYVTDKTRLAELNQRLLQMTQTGSRPRYFQALLKVHVENFFPTQTTLLHVRALENTSQ